MTEWQTMETGPKDGSWILGWNGRWVDIVFFCSGQWDTGTDGALYPQPTHWMLLPDPPQREKKRNDAKTE